MKLRLYGLGVFIVVIFALNPLCKAEGQESKQSSQQVSPSSQTITPLEREKLNVEKWNAGISAFTVLAGSGSIAFSIWKVSEETKAQREARKDDAERQFFLKLIEPVLTSSTPDEAKGRAKAISKLAAGYAVRNLERFQNSLDEFVKEDFGDAGQTGKKAKAKEEKDIKIDFWKTLVEHPGNEQQALELWMALFPDIWDNRVKISPSKGSNQEPAEKEEN